MTSDEIIESARNAFVARDYDTAISLLKPHADIGDIWALENLGTFYLLADPPNGEEAAKLLTAAARKGSGLAAHNLGTLYLAPPPGIQPDPDKSKYWYRVAYDTGFEATVSSDPLWWNK